MTMCTCVCARFRGVRIRDTRFVVDIDTPFALGEIKTVVALNLVLCRVVWTGL